MSDKEGVHIPDIRNSIEELQNERCKLESFFREIIQLEKEWEEKNNDADETCSKLHEETIRLENMNRMDAYRTDVLEKEANEHERQSEALTKELEDLQLGIQNYDDKSKTAVEQFELQSKNVCELFLKASSFNNPDHMENETQKIYAKIEELRKEYDETQLELEKAKSELDDVILYEIPMSQKENDLPLGQRKMVMSLMKDAFKTAQSQLANSKKMVEEKETN